MAQRYFVDRLPAPGEFRLTDELAHHLGTVLRSRPGDEIRLADGRGGSARAGIVAVERREVLLEIGPHEHREPPARRVHLAFAAPRKNRAEWLFEHATEVGVAVFWPLWTTRTRPQGDKPERWQRVVRAAAGQCDRDWLPAIRPALELPDFFAADLPAVRRIADRTGAAPAPKDAPDELVVLVGPEGGFTNEEREAATAAGFEPMRLGPHVLRTETAALLAAGLFLADC